MSHKPYTIDWFFFNVSPITLAFFIIISAFPSEVTAHITLLLFLITGGIYVAKIWQIVYERGLLRWIWNHIVRFSKDLWEMIKALYEFYIAKVVFIVLVTGLVAGSALWCYHHVKIFYLLEDIISFTISIPWYIFNAAELGHAMQRLIERHFISYVTSAVSSAWADLSYTVVNKPLVGGLFLSGAAGTLWIIGKAVVHRQYILETMFPPERKQL
jgi:hypothetical protein